MTRIVSLQDSLALEETTVDKNLEKSLPTQKNPDKNKQEKENLVALCTGNSGYRYPISIFVFQ